MLGGEDFKAFQQRVDKTLKDIDREEEGNSFHNQKRRFSFTVFDGLVEHCLNKGECPLSTDFEKYHYYLIDISVGKYIEERAYYYSKDNIGPDDINRFKMSKDRIEKILNCRNVSNLSSDPFFKYSKEITEVEKIKTGIKNRKAFWSYLTFTPNNNPVTDYEGACGFTEKFHDDFIKLCQSKNKEINHLKNEVLIKKNLHILNAFELYQWCVIKNIISNVSH